MSKKIGEENARKSIKTLDFEENIALCLEKDEAKSKSKSKKLSCKAKQTKLTSSDGLWQPNKPITRGKGKKNSDYPPDIISQIHDELLLPEPNFSQLSKEYYSSSNNFNNFNNFPNDIQNTQILNNPNLNYNHNFNNIENYNSNSIDLHYFSKELNNEENISEMFFYWKDFDQSKFNNARLNTVFHNNSNSNNKNKDVTPNYFEETKTFHAKNSKKGHVIEIDDLNIFNDLNIK